MARPGDRCAATWGGFQGGGFAFHLKMDYRIHFSGAMVFKSYDDDFIDGFRDRNRYLAERSEEHTSELQSH